MVKVGTLVVFIALVGLGCYLIMNKPNNKDAIEAFKKVVPSFPLAAKDA
jgi:hypothetical protein